MPNDHTVKPGSGYWAFSGSFSFLPQKCMEEKKNNEVIMCCVSKTDFSSPCPPPYTAIFIQSCSESWSTEARSHSVPATSLEVCALKDQIHNQHSRRAYNPESPSSTGPSVSLLEPQKQARTPNGLKTYW